jgi:hypothetical protein
MFSWPRLVGCALAIPSDEVIDIVRILFDQSLDTLAVRACLRPRVRDCPAKTNVISNEVCARRIFELVVHIRLLDLEVAIDIAAVMCFAAFRHLLLLLAAGLDESCATWRRHVAVAQGAGPAVER